MTWTPPDDPDPSEILDSAARDTRTGAHAQALAKFVWFHDNGHRINTSLYGVRLSFALTDWMELAAVYPPARAAFVRTRDETETAFRGNPHNFGLFHDLAALNRHLGEGARTAELFVLTAQIDRAAAERLYRVAEPFLIAVGRYEVCGPYLAPATRLWLADDSYKLMSRVEARESERECASPPMARGFYTHDVATLVGLLVLNNRVEEARQARADALAVVDDGEFREMLDAAMTGHLPPPSFS